MIKFMLDTNICIYTINDKPGQVRKAFAQHHGQMCISTVTLMELIHGAERSSSLAEILRSRTTPKNMSAPQSFA